MHDDSSNFDCWPLREFVFEFLKSELGMRSESIVVSMSNILCNNPYNTENSVILRSTEMIEIFVRTVKKCKEVEVFSEELKKIFTKKRLKIYLVT
jgi:hypothetical protein